MKDTSYKHLVYENPEELALLSNILTQISQSEEGKKLVEDAEKHGTKICLSNNIRADGNFNDKTKILTLSSNISDIEKIATLSHELRHSQQFMKGIELDPLIDTPASFIKKQTLIEADAYMTSFIVAWQLKEKNMPEAWEELSKDPSISFKKFKELTEAEGKVTPNIVLKSFREWFNDYPKRDAYEANYVSMIRQEIKKGGELKGAFTRDANMKDEASKICKLGDECYFNNADKFYNRTMLNTICFSTKTSAYNYFFKANKWDLLSDAKENLFNTYGLRIRPTRYYVADYIKDEANKKLKDRQTALIAAKQKSRN